jgi:hypothetical protein
MAGTAYLPSPASAFRSLLTSSFFSPMAAGSYVGRAAAGFAVASPFSRYIVNLKFTGLTQNLGQLYGSL